MTSFVVVIVDHSFTSVLHTLQWSTRNSVMLQPQTEETMSKPGHSSRKCHHHHNKLRYFDSVTHEVLIRFMISYISFSRTTTAHSSLNAAIISTTSSRTQIQNLGIHLLLIESPIISTVCRASICLLENGLNQYLEASHLGFIMLVITKHRTRAQHTSMIHYLTYIAKAEDPECQYMLLS